MLAGDHEKENFLYYFFMAFLCSTNEIVIGDI